MNNLPFLVAALAHSSADSLFFGSHTPGGYTLGWRPDAHVADSVSLAMISGYSWDFVILQEQSQTPAIARLRDSCMYPASMVLHDSIKSANPCSRLLFYLTWGRRFGGTQCFTPNYCSPAFADFNQMQDSLTVAYKKIADSLSAWIAPVGEAWRIVINNTGIVLHDADDSHPNLKGSYLAACVFYDAMFGKHSHGLSFTAGLTADTAALLQQAADSITFSYSNYWNLNNDIPASAFTTNVSSDTLFTHNLSSGAATWLWDFGDGQTSALFEPVHRYQAAGSYPVKLKACNICFCDSVVHHVVISTVGVHAHRPETKLITMTGPDDSGDIRFVNYQGDGSLSFYAVNGEITGTWPVTAGMAKVAGNKSGIWFWLLTGKDSKIVASGKTAR